MTTHIPKRKEHMVHYYDYYSNKSRGQRKKADQDDEGCRLQVPDYDYWSE